MNIQPIVEGYGEVDAVPVLLRRLLNDAGVFTIQINSPIRKRRTELADEDQIRKLVCLARLQENCGAILILFDSDDDCPAHLGPQVQDWAQAAAIGLPCEVVLAHREFESWFLAAIESLRGKRGVRDDAQSHPDPETPRDAKGQLQQQLSKGRSYSETADQSAMTANFDLAMTYGKCRSFRRMVKAFSQLVEGLGETLPSPWPPANWLQG